MKRLVFLKPRRFSKPLGFLVLESPEGFYGIALTSTMIGDVDNGLKNIDIAIEKYTILK
jgi:hypothetical protein